MERAPKIYNLPLSSLGTHETVVMIHDGVVLSHETWNFTEDDQKNRTYMTNNVNVQLFFPSSSIVAVIRA